MNQPVFRFDDGAAYERAMGVWSRLAGDVFLDWVAPQSGLRWIDVGCGNGAFTELVVQRCAPTDMHGIDPSDGQLDFARKRPALAKATLSKGDAMALPYEADRFDAATMALVIFFVPDPKVGIAEMKRVVRPGGTVAAYAWDILNPGGFPFRPLGEELRNAGLAPPMPPSAESSRFDTMRSLWVDAGLQAVEAREITVERTFVDFDEFWSITTRPGSPLTAALGQLSAEQAVQVKARVQAKLPPDAQGRITYSSRANAVKGRVPG